MHPRYINLSIYRIIAALCILQFHIFYIMLNRDIPFEILLSKGVQGLMALSGFLYSQRVIKNVKGFYKNNFIKLIVPALICLSFILVWNVVAMFIMGDYNFFGLLFSHRAYNDTLLFQPSNFYFIIVVFSAYLLTPVLQRKDKWTKLVLILVPVVEIILSYFLNYPISVSAYFIGYYVGKKFFHQYVDENKRFSLPHFSVWFGILLTSLAVYILLVLFFPKGEGYFGIHTKDFLQGIVGFVFGVSTFFVIIQIFRELNKYRHGKFLAFTDKYTYFIYLFNQTFMIGSMNVAAYTEPIWAKFLIINSATFLFAALAYSIYEKVDENLIHPQK